MRLLELSLHTFGTNSLYLIPEARTTSMSGSRQFPQDDPARPVASVVFEVTYSRRSESRIRGRDGG